MNWFSRSTARLRAALILTGVGAALLLVPSCATAPPAKATKIDPSNPDAPEAHHLEVTALAALPAATNADEVPRQPTSPRSTSGGHGHHHHGASSPPDNAAPPADAAGASHAAHEHGKNQPAAEPSSPDGAKAIYTCPMHPEVTSDKPGNCPKCGMRLQRKGVSPPSKNGSQHHGPGGSP
jgi:hypothetical protein